ncbi:MAG: GDP-mannose 4,6-dehydratase [Pseudomonadota bacterium]|nr:GDP-mannose 4,6-dehydratase [Pseudomonadota bacterium]
MEIDPCYFRPTEVEFLLGDPGKAKTRLGWQPEISFDELVKVMVREDLQEVQRDQLCKIEGFRTFNNFE